MAGDLFVDVVGAVGISAGMVRIDLTSRQPVEGSDAGRAELRQRVVMPIQGFLSAMVTMTALAENLLAEGKILPPPTKAAAEDTPPPRSPNFR